MTFSFDDIDFYFRLQRAMHEKYIHDRVQARRSVLGWSDLSEELRQAINKAIDDARPHPNA